MKKLFFILALFMSTSVMAQSEYINVDGLTKEQQAKMQLTVAQMQKPKVATVEKVKEYSELVAAIGDGINQTAKDLGVTVNEFVTTPVGIMTALLITWKYIGSDLLGLVGGIAWFSIMFPLWFYMFRRMMIVKSVTHYEKDAREDGKRKVVEYFTKEDRSDGSYFLVVISFAILTIPSFIMIF